MSAPLARRTSRRFDTSIDDKILRYTVEGLSPEEIAAKLPDGVMSPAGVMLRTREILVQTDWLTDAETELALLRVMRKNLASIQDTLVNVVDKDLLQTSLRYVQELFKRLDKRAESTEVQLDRYNQNVGREMGRVVDMALTYMKGAVRDSIDPDRWDELVEEALIVARNEIAKRQLEEGQA